MGTSAWSNKGYVLDKLSKYDEAIKACEKAIESDQNFTLAWYNQGVALKSLGRTTEAEAAFAKAKALG
jgi:tetratricopeptide (TPR) repeat protein